MDGISAKVSRVFCSSIFKLPLDSEPDLDLELDLELDLDLELKLDKNGTQLEHYHIITFF